MISQQLFQVTVRHLWEGKNIKEAIDERRFHHQLLPMQINYEYGILEVTYPLNETIKTIKS